jgi:cob(I)alamin adenosyltransferase
MKTMKNRGYIHVYTGNGKGKTTAALGLTLRAAGAGKKVFIAQFVKGQHYSEVKAIEKFLPIVEIKQYGLDCFIRNKPTQADIDAAQKGLHEIKKIILSGKYDIVILDEANIAVYYGLFSVQALIDIITQKPTETEIIITGRYSAPELIEMADLVTEMKEIKHYYTQGVEARIGIEH